MSRSKATGVAAPVSSPAGVPLRLSVRVLAGIALAAAALFTAAYIGVAWLRMSYPYELEWMEGGSLDDVARVLAGQPLYTTPTLQFIPYAYPPLYFWIGAGFARVFGNG